MRLSPEDFATLRTMRGNALEAQEIRTRLHERGLRFCGVCERIKEVSDFFKDSRTKHGLRVVCRKCDNRRKPRARKSLVYFMFNGAERKQRHRDSRTPEELQAVYDASNAQRDMDNWRRWYERYKSRSK